MTNPHSLCQIMNIYSRRETCLQRKEIPELFEQISSLQTLFWPISNTVVEAENNRPENDVMFWLGREKELCTHRNNEESNSGAHGFFFTSAASVGPHWSDVCFLAPKFICTPKLHSNYARTACSCSFNGHCPRNWEIREREREKTLAPNCASPKMQPNYWFSDQVLPFRTLTTIFTKYIPTIIK